MTNAQTSSFIAPAVASVTAVTDDGDLQRQLVNQE